MNSMATIRMHRAIDCNSFAVDHRSSAGYLFPQLAKKAPPRNARARRRAIHAISSARKQHHDKILDPKLLWQDDVRRERDTGIQINRHNTDIKSAYVFQS